MYYSMLACVVNENGDIAAPHTSEEDAHETHDHHKTSQEGRGRIYLGNRMAMI